MADTQATHAASANAASANEHEEPAQAVETTATHTADPVSDEPLTEDTDLVAVRQCEAALQQAY